METPERWVNMKFRKNKDIDLILNDSRLRGLAVYYISSGFVMWYAVEVLFLKNTLNLSTVQILSFPLIVKLLSLVFEFPSSVLADRWSRSKSLALSSISGILAATLGFMSHGYKGYLLLALFYSMASSFHTGTDSSLLYDILKSSGKSNHYLRVKNIFNRLFILSITLGSFIGGPLSIATGFRNVYLLSAIFMPLGVIAMIKLKEPSFHKESQEKKALEHIKKSFGLVLKDKKLMLLMFSVAIIDGVVFTSLLEYQPLTYIQAGTPDYLIGILKTIDTNLVFVFLGGLVNNIKTQRNKWLIILIIVVALSCLGTYQARSSVGVLIALSLAFLSSRYISELFGELFQYSIPSSERASMTSLIGILSGIVFGITWPLLALFSSNFGDNGYLLFSSTIAGALSILIFYIIKVFPVSYYESSGSK